MSVALLLTLFSVTSLSLGYVLGRLDSAADVMKVTRGS